MEQGGKRCVARDVEINRKLCLYLMRRLAAVLSHVAAYGEEEAVLPPWAATLFGGREGISGAYIRLSQQHLKIVEAQMRLAEDGGLPEPEEALGFSPEDITTIRALLVKMEDVQQEAMSD